ncbi:hypothetical protein BHM03_00031671 [Ensete ventricosum]|nr:hypothetical protein BHM03_00031671 [Ensete ventricosum]
MYVGCPPAPGAYTAAEDSSPELLGIDNSALFGIIVVVTVEAIVATSHHLRSERHYMLRRVRAIVIRFKCWQSKVLWDRLVLNFKNARHPSRLSLHRVLKGSIRELKGRS